jgi:hypothetical protein
MNAAVVAKNGGVMPVLMTPCSADTLDGDPIHVCWSKDTKWKFLADWVVIHNVGVASPGDFFEWTYEKTFIPALFAWFILTAKDRNRGSIKEV